MGIEGTAVTKRQSNFEALRILSIILIVLFHYVWNAHYDWSRMHGFPKLVIDLIYMFGELGVNCFMLISGYFLAASRHPFRIKKLALLVLQVLFYSLLAAVVLYVISPYKVGPFKIYQTLFPLTSKSWWYATTYVLLYMCSPYLNRLLQNLSRGEYRRLLIFEIGIWCVLLTAAGVF